MVTRPVLVTGAPRTGTTWLGRMLTLSGELAELYEPFNPNAHQARWFDPPHHYVHFDDTNAGRYDSLVSDMAALRYPLAARLAASRARPAEIRRAVTTSRVVAAHRRAGRAAMVKDPMALFSTPWLAERHGFRPVILVRHPCGFVSSVLRVGWTINFRSWTRQPRLMSTLLAPWRDEVEAAAERGAADPLAEASLLWKVCTGVIARFEDEHPDWIVVRHEDLARDPIPAFAELYDRLGLRWSDDVRARITDENGADLPAEVEGTQQHQMARDSRAVADVWRRRLTDEQVVAVRAAAGPVAERYYAETAR